MNPNRKIVGATVSIILATGAFMLLYSRKEPTHDGRTVSEWVSDMSNQAADEEKTRKAEEAIRQIGTNALPVVLRELNVRDDTFLTMSLGRLYWKSGFSKVWVWRRRRPEMRREQGYYALRALAPALGVSLLTNLMANPNRSVRDAAARSLLYVESPHVGFKGVRAILQALDSDRAEIREAALAGFVENGPVLQEAYPLIVKLTDDPNPEIRRRVAVALWWYPTAFGTADLRALVEPALIKLLKDPDPTVTQAATNVSRFYFRGRKLLEEAQK